MIRAAILLGLTFTLLTGCDQLGPKGDQQEQVDNVIRLTEAPAASDAFLARYSAVECKAKIKDICTAKGCEEAPVSVTQRYDVRNRVYQRQGFAGVEQFEAEASPSGVWFNFELSNPTLLFRVNTLGDFKEVVTTNDLVVVYSGSCQFR
jgi:hypothetical protein